MAIESVLKIIVALEDYPDAVDNYIKPSHHGPSGVEQLVNLLNAVASGVKKGLVMAHADEADGAEGYTHTICTQASAATDDTLTVCGIVLTAKASGASANPFDGEFNIGASDAAMADNLVICINNHPFLKHLVYASEDSDDNNGVVIQYRIPGNHNFGSISSSNASGMSEEITTYANGTAGTEQVNTRVYHCGLHGDDPAQVGLGS